MAIFVMTLTAPDKSYAASVSTVKVQINGKTMTFPNGQPVITNGRTMVPIRDIAEALGYAVTWNSTTQTVGIKNTKSSVSLKVGSKTMSVNGKNITMDAAPYVSKGSTMVPLRFVAEGLGTKFTWNQQTSTVNIIDPSVNYVPTVPVPAKNKTIVLDPGHGGKFPGAVGIDGTKEQLYNYNYALSAKSALESAGYKVVLTRGANNSCVPNTTINNTDLACRVNVSKTNKADLFISIHANASTSSVAKGTETHYSSQNPYATSSAKFAKIVQPRVVKALGTTNRGVINSSLYVTRNNSAPAVLLELAFVSNSSDTAILKNTTKRANFGKELTTAVNEYFK